MMVAGVTSPVTYFVTSLAAGLEHLHGLSSLVLDPSIVTQQVRSLLQRLNPVLDHGPQDRDAVQAD